MSPFERRILHYIIQSNLAIEEAKLKAMSEDVWIYNQVNSIRPAAVATKAAIDEMKRQITVLEKIEKDEKVNPE